MATSKSKQTTGTAFASMQDVFAASQDAMQTFVKAGTDGYGKAFEGIKFKADGMVKGYDDLAATGKDNVDAMVTAGAVYAKGMEAIASELVNFTKAALEQNISNARAVMAAKNVHDVMDIQTGFAKTNFDEFVSQSTKVGEMAAKVAQDTIEPLNARMVVTMEKLSGSAA